jgi:hypothetical protein
MLRNMPVRHPVCPFVSGAWETLPAGMIILAPGAAGFSAAAKFGWKIFCSPHDSTLSDAIQGIF